MGKLLCLHFILKLFWPNQTFNTILSFPLGFTWHIHPCSCVILYGTCIRADLKFSLDPIHKRAGSING